MKAPIDKLEARGNPIIQIEVTTACNEACSNCTRLLEFRRDFVHMNLECFREAVRSLADWPGIVGIFGGNPCAHHRFAELMAIYCEEIPDQRHRGLWSNNLLKHGELVREVFYPDGYFNLNVHRDARAAVAMASWVPGKLIVKSVEEAAWHGPILMDRRDYGISDADWIDARERCDINQNWSAIVTQRGGKPFAYFCEVAASLDGVRGENAGIPVEPGWWRWRMDRFDGQVRNCCDRGCGVPLRLKGHVDSDEKYDVSPSWKAELPWHSRRVALDEHTTLPTEQTLETTDYMRLRT